MKRKLTLLALLTLLLAAANLLYGAVRIPPGAVWQILCGVEVERMSWSYIIWESRLPQMVTALLTGMALSTAGLLLQTTFRNPLADASILGISAGASLGVAVVMLLGINTFTAASVTLSGFLTIVAAALCGAVVIMAVILCCAARISNPVLLLITGLMVGYLATSATTLLAAFSATEGLQRYVVWGMGSFAGVSRAQLPYYAAALIVALVGATLLAKPLNALLLGEHYAANLGVNVPRTRHLLLFLTSLLTAITTAFCGPIAFIGLAVPHIARFYSGTAHHGTLLPTTLLCGGAIALLCNLISVLPTHGNIIPLNAVTPLLGAPVIIYVLLHHKGQ